MPPIVKGWVHLSVYLAGNTGRVLKQEAKHGGLSRMIMYYTSRMNALSIKEYLLPLLENDTVEDQVGIGTALLMQC